MKKIKVNSHEVAADALLVALYNNAKPIGLGHLFDRGHLTRAEARKVIEAMNAFQFDYLFGRPLKVYESEDGLDGRLYDRDNGAGSFDRAVEQALAMGM